MGTLGINGIQLFGVGGTQGFQLCLMGGAQLVDGGFEVGKGLLGTEGALFQQHLFLLQLYGSGAGLFQLVLQLFIQIPEIV